MLARDESDFDPPPLPLRTNPSNSKILLVIALRSSKGYIARSFAKSKQKIPGYVGVIIMANVSRRDLLGITATGLGALWLKSAVPTDESLAASLTASGGDARSSGPTMKLAWRINPRQWQANAQFERLLALLTEHRGVVDELALFVGDIDLWHGYQPLDEFATVMRLAGERMRTLRAKGFVHVGINVWPTMGSDLVPGRERRPPLPFQAMVSYDGKPAHSAACPSSPEFLAYTRKRYGLVAEQRPEFIWVDDDTRMTHLGIAFPCFCPICLGIFDGGRWRQREDLVSALNEPSNKALRQQWTEFNTVRLERLCTTIREGIQAVDPKIDIGWMTVGETHSTYSGRYVNRCGTVLGGRRGRPGHGFYSDEKPRDLIFKLLEVSRQVREYPPNIVDIQHEYEDYPSIPLDKALQTTANEITATLVAGCNGVAMHVLGLGASGLDEYHPLLKRLAMERPAWDQLVKACVGLPLAGLWPADSPLLMANRTVGKQGWFHEDDPMYDIAAPNQWAELGFAFTAEPKSACGTLLAGQIAEALSDGDLQRILSGAVFMDVAALQVVHKRGFGSLTGVEPAEQIGGVLERLAGHPLNGKYAGEELYTSLDAGWKLRVTASQVEVLSVLVDLLGAEGNEWGPCLTAYRNERGGRVVVMGYTPWVRLGRECKLHQLRGLVDWATEGKMPLMFDRPVRVTPLMRMNAERNRFAAVLLNNGLDDTGVLNVEFRANVQAIRLLKSSGQQVALPLQRTSTAVVTKLQSLPAWRTAILLGD